MIACGGIHVSPLVLTARQLSAAVFRRVQRFASVPAVLTQRVLVVGGNCALAAELQHGMRVSGSSGVRWLSSNSSKKRDKKGGAGASSSGGSSKPAAAPPTTAPPANNGRGIDGDFVFGITDVSKTLPGGRVLFKNANLLFQRGAKVGILGSNGSGKSSLLKILAKVDRFVPLVTCECLLRSCVRFICVLAVSARLCGCSDFDGKVWHNDGVRIGYLQQEPQLDATKDVQGNVMDGLREKTSLLERMDELSANMGAPDADIDAVRVANNPSCSPLLAVSLGVSTVAGRCQCCTHLQRSSCLGCNAVVVRPLCTRVHSS